MKRVALLLGLSAASFALAMQGASAADLVQPYVPPPPSLLFGGTIGIEGGVRFYDDSDANRKDEDVQLGASGAYNIPLGDMFSLQLDAHSEFYLGKHGVDDISESAHAFGGHLSFRDPQSFLVGVFGGGIVSEIGRDEASTDLGYVLGLEGQFYLDQFTFYAQGGYADIDTTSDGDDESFDGFFVRGVGRFFVTDNTMIQGEVAYGFPDTYVDDDDGEIWNWGLKATTRLIDDVPLYGSLAYRGGHYDSPQDGDKVEEHAVLAGITFLFGANSLKENDRYGATLEMPMLPSRAASWTEAID